MLCGHHGWHKDQWGWMIDGYTFVDGIFVKSNDLFFPVLLNLFAA